MTTPMTWFRTCASMIVRELGKIKETKGYDPAKIFGGMREEYVLDFNCFRYIYTVPGTDYKAAVEIVRDEVENLVNGDLEHVAKLATYIVLGLIDKLPSITPTCGVINERYFDYSKCCATVADNNTPNFDFIPKTEKIPNDFILKSEIPKAKVPIMPVPELFVKQLRAVPEFRNMFAHNDLQFHWFHGLADTIFRDYISKELDEIARTNEGVSLHRVYMNMEYRFHHGNPDGTSTFMFLVEIDGIKAQWYPIFKNKEWFTVDEIVSVVRNLAYIMDSKKNKKEGSVMRIASLYAGLPTYMVNEIIRKLNCAQTLRILNSCRENYDTHYNPVALFKAITATVNYDNNTITFFYRDNLMDLSAEHCVELCKWTGMNSDDKIHYICNMVDKLYEQIINGGKNVMPIERSDKAKKYSVPTTTGRIKVVKVETYNDRVTKVTFEDGTYTKSVCSPNDKFDIDVGITVCLMKKMLGSDGNKRYNNLMRDIHELMEENEKAKQREKEERAEQKKRNREANERKHARKEQARREQIDIQKKAILEALQERERGDMVKAGE